MSELMAPQIQKYTYTNVLEDLLQPTPIRHSNIFITKANCSRYYFVYFLCFADRASWYNSG